MILYLLRHGEAEPRDHDDPGRQLTHRGKADLQNIAHQFVARGLRLQRCLHSPYTRTTQTAALFLAHIRSTLTPEPLQLLTPERGAREVLAFLATAQDESVLLVGHNPLMSEMLALLTTSDLSHAHVIATSELNAVQCDAVGVGFGVQQFRLLPHAI